MNYQQTQREHAPITFDPTDLTDMCKIMDTYGDSEVPFFGRNENDEDTCLSVFHDRITVKTHQHNGWVRLNTYWRDGTREECQRQFEIVRKRRRNHVVFRRGGG